MIELCLALAATVATPAWADAPPPPSAEEIAAIMELEEVLNDLELLEHLETLEVLPLLQEPEDDR